MMMIEKLDGEKIKMEDTKYDYLTARGTYEDVIHSISSKTGLPDNYVRASLSVLLDNPEMISSGEALNIESDNDTPEKGKSGLVFGGEKYYINIRRSLLWIDLITASIMLLEYYKIDSKQIIATAFLSGGFKMDELSGYFPFELEEKTGQKCILLEMEKNRGTPFTARDLKKQIGRSCNKEYDCRFRKNGKCKAKSDDIEKILEGLKDRHALTGNEAGYHLNW